MTTPADALVVRLLAADTPRDEVDATACELLALVSSGASVEAVRPLLTSDVPHARRAGAFVLSELGATALPLLPDAVGLLSGESRLLRYYALDALHGAAASLTPDLVAAVLPVLADEEEVLREKVMSLLVHVDDATLAALPATIAASGDADPGLVEDVTWAAGARPGAVAATLRPGPGLPSGADAPPSRRAALAAVVAVRLAGEWDGAWAALAGCGVDELVRFGDEQRQIAGRLRRRGLAVVS